MRGEVGVKDVFRIRHGHGLHGHVEMFVGVVLAEDVRLDAPAVGRDGDAGVDGVVEVSVQGREQKNAGWLFSSRSLERNVGSMPWARRDSGPMSVAFG